MRSILFIIANLAILTFSLPTTNSSSSPTNLLTTNITQNPPLSKRLDDRAWIGSHWLPGCATHGPLPPDAQNNEPEGGYVTGPRPKLRKGQCVQWSPSSFADYIGIFWGEGKNAMSHVEVHQADDCSDTPEIVIDRTGNEAGHCLSPGQPGMGQWTVWNAVKGIA